ncbi:hypothetical protein EVAR_96651_1 [Eumeta japonica]|uniref:Uncharacterized protein n=1 Tax=Eumeta variegata TaxID=151549 RepID=A0A4C2A5B7_EUMVA|nr:hypothetical protein EVAR_96651_1 [Eumeta japonica]
MGNELHFASTAKPLRLLYFTPLGNFENDFPGAGTLRKYDNKQFACARGRRVLEGESTRVLLNQIKPPAPCLDYMSYYKEDKPITASIICLRLLPVQQPVFSSDLEKAGMSLNRVVGRAGRALKAKLLSTPSSAVVTFYLICKEIVANRFC